jgi:glycosyltransferase involved in cell wall biosynthesis
MIRVLRIINRFNLGGPTFNAAYLTRYLGDEFETLLVGGQKDESEADSEYIVNSLGIDPVRIPEMQRSINPILDYQAYIKIKQIIKEFKPDIVHTHASKSGALGRRAASYLKVPVIIHTFHGHVFDAYFNQMSSNFYIRLERHLAQKSDAIITLSENQFSDITEKYKIAPREKTHIIPLGFDLSRFSENKEEKRKQFREKYSVAEDEIAIGIIGRLVPVKNHELFVEAIDELYRNSSKKIRAFIVGDGETRANIEQMFAQRNIPFSNGTDSKEIVVFTSWQKDVDIVNAGLDIVTLTSLNEGTPVSLIEAQASGKPIVTTNVGGIQNIVQEGKTALIADILHKEDFISKLKSVVENDSLRTSLSNKGWEFVSDKFHYTRLIKDVKHLYISILEKKKFQKR